jgi:hypothetical protein
MKTGWPKRTKKLGYRTLLFLGCGLLALAMSLAMRTPRGRTISLGVQVTPFGSNGTPRCIVVLSNCSGQPVSFRSGELGPDYIIMALVDGVWQQRDLGDAYRERGLLPPHFYNERLLPPHVADTNTFDVPPRVAAIKVGLSYVRYSWLGKLVRNSAPRRAVDDSWLKEVWSSVCRSLLRHDAARGSGTEWSSIHTVIAQVSAASPGLRTNKSVKP